MPHKHPEDRTYTVMSGVFYIGLGAIFDAENVQAYQPGSVVVLPGETWHFHWAKSGEYVTQVTAIGPLGLEYQWRGNAADGILAMSGASVNARARTCRGLKNEHPCSFPGVAPWHSGFGPGPSAVP